MNSSRKTLAHRADKFGILLSQLCLVHCLALPALLALLPSQRLEFLDGGESLHTAILVLASPTAIFALLSGRRVHQKNFPLVLGLLGLGFLWAEPLLETLFRVEPWLHRVGGLGSLLLLVGHLANLKSGGDGHACCMNREKRGHCDPSDDRPDRLHIEDRPHPRT